MLQKGLKREKRGIGRKEKKLPQNFFFCLPDYESPLITLLFEMESPECFFLS